MSAQTRGGDATAHERPPDIDAYPIEIPPAFVEAFEGDTVVEKLRNAERAPSTTEREDMGQCPRCYSVRLSPKPGYDSQHDQPGTLACTQCRAHLGVPGGAEGFDGAARPIDPRREVVPVEVGSASRYHLADGCAFVGATERLTAAEVVARGLTPCEADACQPDVQWRACDHCGAPTFGAVDGIPQTICAECTVVSDDD